MSLDELQSLAYAAGYGAVFDEEIDLARAEPIERLSKTLAGQQADWRSPDAPAPRAAIATDRSLVVVQPLWLSQPEISPVASSWTRHLLSASRGVSSLLAGRGLPA